MYEFEHSVLTRTSREFAWAFWTDVSNWAFDKSIEWVRLDGPFASGTSGVTKPVDGDPVNWVLTGVDNDRHEATIEISANDATVRFAWRFEDAGAEGTRLVQRLSLSGHNADFFREQVSEGFARGIPAGMDKLAAEIERARRERLQGS